MFLEETSKGKMQTLVGVLVVVVVSGVSGDDTVNVSGFVGEDALLPCTCSDRNSSLEFKWQTEGQVERVVSHTGDIPPHFSDNYKARAKLRLSENSSDCSLLLKNITLKDERKYKCIFKAGKGRYTYSFVNLTVLEGPAFWFDVTTPAPPEPTSSGKIWTLYCVLPVALVALTLFLLYKRRVSVQPTVGEEERELKISA